MTDSSFVEDITTSAFVKAVVDRSLEVPVLVDFWATWCGPCRVLGPILERLAKEYDGSFILAKVDTDREQALATQFQIRSIPTVMLFKNGKSVGGFPGALPEGQIRSFLGQHGVVPRGREEHWSADATERASQLRAALEADASRSDLRLKLAVALTEAGEDREARQALDSLPAVVFSDPSATRARGVLDLRTFVATLAASDPVRVGVEQVLKGETARGVDALLDALRVDHSEHSPARAALVAVLQTATDEEFVRETRRRMARVLF